MTSVSDSLRAQIRQRAGARCEYCRLPESAGSYPFHIEHIIARKHDGSSEPDNLAWSCFLCNVAKGSDIASYDRETGELTPLYNPRLEDWDEHFVMVEGEIVGTTPVGRVTAKLLRLNSPDQLTFRKVLIRSGQW